MKKFIVFFVIIVLAIFAGGVFGKTLQSEDTRLATTVEKTAAKAAVPSFTPTPTESPLKKPVSLAIPKLSINTSVEHVGKDKDGNMDVPKKDENVGWYEPGFLPGAKGNAVLAGHFDKKNGGPAVFYKLGSLDKGDEVIVTDEEGKKLTFVVTDKTKYPTDSFPVSTVFGPSGERYLNLITCGGVWDSTKRIYAERLVIRTELKEE
jgi:LPXTG-site transpeptidase (sortase) family protein